MNKWFNAGQCLLSPKKCDVNNLPYVKKVITILVAPVIKANDISIKNVERQKTDELMKGWTDEKKESQNSLSEQKGKAIFIIAGVVLLIVILMLVWNG